MIKFFKSVINKVKNFGKAIIKPFIRPIDTAMTAIDAVENLAHKCEKPVHQMQKSSVSYLSSRTMHILGALIAWVTLPITIPATIYFAATGKTSWRELKDFPLLPLKTVAALALFGVACARTALTTVAFLIALPVIHAMELTIISPIYVTGLALAALKWTVLSPFKLAAAAQDFFSTKIVGQQEQEIEPTINLEEIKPIELNETESNKVIGAVDKNNTIWQMPGDMSDASVWTKELLVNYLECLSQAFPDAKVNYNTNSPRKRLATRIKRFFLQNQTELTFA